MTETEDHLTANAGSLRLVGVGKAYDTRHLDRKAVSGIDLEIAAGTFVTLLGPSGCGKTTTLRMIAGFESPTEGDILLDGTSIMNMAPEKRPMSMVFQSYALFPHLSVRDNVGFGLKIKGLDRQARRTKVDEGLRLMGIEQYADRYPHQLSGGQQQRVALARALVMEPKIVLFDEPLSNLDARLRVRMREEIRSLQRRLGLTAVFVTHDQSEALTMSDVIVVMSAGRVEQVGSPTEIYRRPANRFVASFLGTSNFVEGSVDAVGGESAHGARYRMTTPLGGFEVSGVPGLVGGDRALVVARAEHLAVGASGGADATVRSVAFDGSVVNYVLDTPVGPMQGQAPGTGPIHDIGESTTVALDRDALWAIPHAETTR